SAWRSPPRASGSARSTSTRPSGPGKPSEPRPPPRPEPRRGGRRGRSVERAQRRRSVVPGEGGPVGVSLLEEAVPALLGLVGHVGEAGGLAGEHLLADEAVVDQVEGELQHPLSG